MCVCARALRSIPSFLYSDDRVPDPRRHPRSDGGRRKGPVKADIDFPPMRLLILDAIQGRRSRLLDSPRCGCPPLRCGCSSWPLSVAAAAVCSTPLDAAACHPCDPSPELRGWSSSSPLSPLLLAARPRLSPSPPLMAAQPRLS